jgi:benzylsuccinate CoA-transferase BbsE subunit
MAGPWSGVRVLETGGLTAAYACRLWAALGAEVIVCEAPEGSPLRHLPPFAPGTDESLWWAYYGQGKRSVVAAPGAWDRLVASADVVVHDVDPMSPQAPPPDRLVRVDISPFGSTGPRASWMGSDLVAWASSGLAHTFGFPDRPPVGIAPAVQFASHVTSMYAVNAAMLALRARKLTGRGQVVDVSMQECCLSLAPETGVPLFLDDRLPRNRPGNRRAVTRPWGLYPCADGFVSFLVLQPNHWRSMATWIAEETGMDAVLDEAFVDMRVRWEVSDFIDDLTEQLTRDRTKIDLFVEGQRRGIPVTPVNTVGDLRADPHLRSAGFWRTEQHPTLGALEGPGAPFRVNHDWFGWTSAPALGEHTAELLAGV